MKSTPEREKQFDAITWMTTKTSYVLPSASAAVKSTEDLCGKKVALVTGSIVEGQPAQLSAFCKKKGKPAVESVGLADTNATLLAAESGRADAAGMTQAAAIDVTAKQKGKYTYVTQTEEQGATTDNLAMLVSKDEGLGKVMLDAWQRLFDSGEYQKIMTKHGLDGVTVPKPVLNVGGGG